MIILFNFMLFVQTQVQNGRVNGALGVARSFGDVEFKVLLVVGFGRKWQRDSLHLFRSTSLLPFTSSTRMLIYMYLRVVPHNWSPLHQRFGVVALPDLRAKFKVGTGDEFVLLACDGLWNRFEHHSLRCSNCMQYSYRGSVVVTLQIQICVFVGCARVCAMRDACYSILQSLDAFSYSAYLF